MNTEFYRIVSAFGEIAESVENFQFSQEESVSQLRAKIRLFDGTSLRVREVQIRGKSDVYNYYWLRPDDSDYRMGQCASSSGNIHLPLSQAYRRQN